MDSDSLRRVFPGVLILATVCGLAGGCQQQSTSNFQSFQEKRAAGYVPPDSFPEDDSPADSLPLDAELEPDSAPETMAAEQPASAFAPLNVIDGSSVTDLLRVTKSPVVQAAGSSTGDSAGEQPAQTPRIMELLIKEKEFRPEGPQGALRVSYDDLDLLKVLNLEPVPTNAVEYFPDWLKQLDGQKIRIRGFMMPTFESSGLERFVMARDTGLCCFGRNPKVYDLISVELKANKPTDYIHLRPFDVIGTLKIDMVAEGDKPLGLYWIEDAEVVQK